MITATETNGTMTATARGFRVKCICCNEESVKVSLDDTSVFSCSSCDEEFTAADVREYLAAWSAVLAWVELAPKV